MQTAARAGSLRGDLIVAIDGTKTQDSAHVRNLVAISGKGKKISVDLLREGKPRTVEVTLAELPDQGSPSASPEGVPEGPFLGVTVQELDAAARRQLRVPETLRGVLVTGAWRDGRGPTAGLQQGDVILEVNRQPTPTVEAYQRAVKSTGSRALVLVYRSGFTLFLSLTR